MKKTILAICFTLSIFVIQAQVIRYVTQSGAGNGTGLSWADAADSSKVQLMMNQVNTAGGGQVWIAAGTYLPTATPPGCNNCAGIVRRYTFVLKEKVAVYGGFAGGETLLSQANPALNKTIWSGNCGSLSDSTDNSVHIAVASSVYDTATVCGITFSGAYAGNIGNISLANDGGGLALVSGNVKLLDCVFENNVALGYGSAIISQTGSLNMRRCTIRNNTQLNGAVASNTFGTFIIDSCMFLNNTTYGDTGQGGAMYLRDNSHISNCVFEGNTVRNGKGGAMTVTNSDVKIERCVFADNEAGEGGAIATISANGQSIVELIVTNSVFYNNKATKGGAMASFSDTDIYGYHLTVCNNTADSGSWCYSNGYGGGRFYNSIGDSNIGPEKTGPGIFSNNLLQYTMANNLLGTATFANAANPKGADGIWMTADDGFMLACASAGQDLVTTTPADSFRSDILGISRPQGQYNDMGAYEKIPTGTYPIIDSIEQLGEICVGSTGNFSVAFTNAGNNYTYAWKVNNNAVSGSLDSLSATIPYNVPITYSLTSPDYCAGSNTVSTSRLASSLVVVTPSAVLNVTQLLVCDNTQPADIRVLGAYLGTDPTYQWYFNNQPIGSDTNLLHLNSYNFGDSIHCAVRSNRGCLTVDTCVTNKAPIDMFTLPYFEDLDSITAAVTGTDIVLDAHFGFAYSPVSYTWQVSTSSGFVNITPNAQYSTNAAGNILTITNVSAALDGYQYRCIKFDTCQRSDTTLTMLRTVSNIIGRTYLDYNGDCAINNNDAGLMHVKHILSNNGSMVKEALSGTGGIFDFDVPVDNYTVTIDTTNLPLSATCPAVPIQNIVLSQNDSVANDIDFGFRCKPGFDLAAHSVSSVQIFRPANNTTVNINVGDLANFYNAQCAIGVTGIVTVTMHGPISYVSPAPGATAPTNVSGDTLVWNITDFATVNAKGDFNIIVVTDTFAQAGEQACFSVNVTPTIGDNNTANNTLSHCMNIVNSHDPNDKQVYPSANIDTAQKWLTYTVRFQNTGTAEAQHIYIMDTLDTDIDVSNFQLLAYSHQPGIQINERIVRFNFPNINLPDSNSNEPGSHGFVQYKVKLKEGLTLGTEIKNTAYIYFDFNEPVVTNTTLNTISDETISGINNTTNKQLSLSIYPNPASQKVTIVSNEANYAIDLYNAQGKLIATYFSNGNAHTFDISQMESGLYYVGVSGKYNTVQKKLVKL